MEAPKNNLKERPPVVVVMGHVDHGKTSLLDFIRKANVASREAGGITQAVSAYEIIHNGKKITFIDTPGHEAFSRMRSRGASIADVAILVIAAEEGTKPQTLESIKILKETKTPYVVAITKIDKASANIEKVKSDLAAADVLLEGYGGQISFQGISSKTGEGISDLLDLLLLTAEVEQLTFDSSLPASGFILESQQTTKRGIEVVLVVKNGVLKFGDHISTVTAKGRVKILEDFQGKAAKSLEPSAPALVVGFETLPVAGEEFIVGDTSNIQVAVPQSFINSADQYATTPEDQLNIVLRASEAGSLEVLSQIVRSMSTQRPIKVVAEGVGEVSDNDIKLLKSIGGIVIAFKSKASKSAATMAQLSGISVISSDIVYQLVTAIEGAVSDKSKDHYIAVMEVLGVFNQARNDKQLFGGKVTRGTLKEGQKFDVIRDNKPVGQGRITSLRIGKKDVEEIGEGAEGGLVASVSTPVAVGDSIMVK
jgi:translation initiation factor IF-2